MTTRRTSLWRLASYNNGIAFASDDFSPTGLPVIRIRQLLNPDVKPDLTERLGSSRALLGNDDVVFSWSGSLAVRIWDRGPAWLNQHLFKVVPVEGVNARWLRWVIESSLPSFEGMTHGSAMTHLNLDMLKRLYVDFPSDEDQRRIACFLDVHVGRIDKTVARRQLMRRALVDRRASMVFRSVTGSEIEERIGSTLPWVETLPSSWEVVKLSYVARLGSGHTPSRNRPELWVDCSIPWVTTGEVGQMRSDRLEYLEDPREKISRVGMENSSAELHPAGTVALCRTAASAGYSAIMATDMATSQDIATWTCGRDLKSAYLLWCLRAMRTDLLERLAIGSTHKTIYMPDLQALRIPLPSVAEQERIVADIRHSIASIDAAIDAVDQQLELLAERRQTLITAAVTGQVDVSTASGVSV